ncbi:MAG: dipeptidase [Myxococcota bacterium]
MKNSVFFISLSLFLALFQTIETAQACTNFLVTKKASSNNSNMITYAADSHDLYGELYYRPRKTWGKDKMMKVHEWDTGKYLGKIKQAEKTYRVVGNMNEHQLVIGETTWGGPKELRNKKGLIDYGSLIYITLQRAKTAREAIKTMGKLVKKYGYYSSGETFSLADKEEVWIMDLIGKGPDNKGAVWVARRLPPGYVTAHANRARIRKFPLDDPENCLYSKDVISFAREKGYFKGKDKDFSFVDAYAPADCKTLRVCSSRVWSFFRAVAPSLNIPSDYVKCVKTAEPLPLWVKPDKKLSALDLMELMRDHFEGTEFDLSKGVGAGPYELPYRWRPLTWEYKGKKYLNERVTATQQTGFSFVSQSRAELPDPVGGILWFSVDDAASTVYVPMYAGLTEIPKPYAVDTADFHTFSWDSAFWVFNWVANFAYSRYKDMIKDIKEVQSNFEKGFVEKQEEIDKIVATMAKAKGNSKAINTYLNEYSGKVSENVLKRWKKLGQELLMKYMDGNVRNKKDKAEHPGYPKHWYKRIVEENGEHFRVPENDKKMTDAQRRASKDTTKKDKKDKEDKKTEKQSQKKDMSPAAKTKKEKTTAKDKAKGCGCNLAGETNSTLPLLVFSFFFTILAVFRFSRN